MWRLSRSQLNDSVKQQVDLASVALERWLDDQKKALDAIALLAGIDAYLTKPFEPEELIAVVNAILSRVERTHLQIARLVRSGNVEAPSGPVSSLKHSG